MMSSNLPPSVIKVIKLKTAVSVSPGEVLLVPIAGNMETLDSLFTLNPTAAAMWKHTRGGATREEITASLLSKFAVSPEEAAQDVDQFLKELTTIGALLAEDSA